MYGVNLRAISMPDCFAASRRLGTRSGFAFGPCNPWNFPNNKGNNCYNRVGYCSAFIMNGGATSSCHWNRYFNIFLSNTICPSRNVNILSVAGSCSRGISKMS